MNSRLLIVVILMLTMMVALGWLAWGQNRQIAELTETHQSELVVAEIKGRETALAVSQATIEAAEIKGRETAFAVSQTTTEAFKAMPINEPQNQQDWSLEEPSKLDGSNQTGWAIATVIVLLLFVGAIYWIFFRKRD
ncbi:MAG: hypothetical protein US62_C0013G0017 [Candidatus Woesebacteria bacterium GW2011_GWA1_37_8]|uniref:Uncharacterized protein n=1 Tax=Candidatus Woesebacteria bacterium GW2011_GWA1_37_8 TaxID=1618546 RepID=A0A0G0K8W3_9BACT|nr:MAG: hypothetical protein US62_C0013G0017 [Candidatus Woesebacteria bacterium GW2011_GWA1_37_8]